MLEASAINKHYGELHVLQNVEFQLRPGEILGLIGPNGSGKSTLFEVIAGLASADSGTVRLKGKPLTPDERASHLFLLPDGVVPYPNETVIRLLQFFANWNQADSRTRELAVTGLGLEPVLGKRVRALSKGFRKRLLLAIALLSRQPTLLLDEPFDGFDLKQTMAVMDLLKEVKAAGRTLFLSIHQLRDAERMCERFLLLSAGKVIGHGTLEELRQLADRPAGDLEEVFLALT